MFLNLCPHLATIDVFHSRLTEQEVHVVLCLEASNELRIVQPSTNHNHHNSKFSKSFSALSRLLINLKKFDLKY